MEGLRALVQSSSADGVRVDVTNTFSTYLQVSTSSVQLQPIASPFSPKSLDLATAPAPQSSPSFSACSSGVFPLSCIICEHFNCQAGLTPQLAVTFTKLASYQQQPWLVLDSIQDTFIMILETGNCTYLFKLQHLEALLHFAIKHLGNFQLQLL